MEHSILIVDDEKSTRDSLAEFLSNDYIVHTASNGYDAIEKVNRHQDIKLILSDINMPEMDGIVLMEKIRSSRKDIKTIFITGTSAVITAVDVMRKGAFYFLSKPVDLNKLGTTIRTALADKNSGKLLRSLYVQRNMRSGDN
jgi:DNA-binding NtrC family response regulator